MSHERTQRVNTIYMYTSYSGVHGEYTRFPEPNEPTISTPRGGYSGYILVGVCPGTPKKGGLRCGHSPKRGVLGAGTAPKKGVLGAATTRKRGVLGTSTTRKRGNLGLTW